MENARKLADCYFYYYSTCTKGDACNFRHEPEALGSESMCFYWQQGKCFDQHCKLRHMELRKNRKQIPCYWETQPGGCRKKHCSFLHKNPQARIDGISPSQPNLPLPGGRDVPQHGVNRETGEVPPGSISGITPGLHQPGAPQPTPSPNVSHNALAPNWQRQVEPAMLRGTALDGQHAGIPPLAPMNPMSPMAPINSMTPLAAAYSALQPVDSLVVNFEEESDSESVCGMSPLKNCLDDAKHRVDLMLLEQIQEETAAYYSYDFTMSSVNVSIADVDRNVAEEKAVKRKLPMEYECLSLDELQGLTGGVKRKQSEDFKILSLDEIRERKRQRVQSSDSSSSTSNLNENVTNFDFKMNFTTNQFCDNVNGGKAEQTIEVTSTVPGNRQLKRKLSLKVSVSNNTEDRDNSMSCERTVIDVETMECDVDEDSVNTFNSNTNFNENNSKCSNASSSDSRSTAKGEEVTVLESTLSLSNSMPDLVKCCSQTDASLHKNN